MFERLDLGDSGQKMTSPVNWKPARQRMSFTPLDTRDVAMGLLAARAPESTICPSEIARGLVARFSAAQSADWRSVMPEVHAVIDELLAEGLVQLSWKGTKLATRKGPYRISLARTGDGEESAPKVALGVRPRTPHANPHDG